jgi:hypothetical protein
MIVQFYFNAVSMMYYNQYGNQGAPDDLVVMEDLTMSRPGRSIAHTYAPDTIFINPAYWVGKTFMGSTPDPSKEYWMCLYGCL